MTPIVECVPNFSGRYEALGDPPGVWTLDRHYDPDHNRSVLTFAGPPAAVLEAAVWLAGRAAASLDLGGHAGVHPRIGVIDVCPFVPVRGVTLEECAALAIGAGTQIWAKFQIPVFLYEAAARKPEHRSLSRIRRDIESLTPDIGQRPFHSSAGAAAVGARPFLIAYNVNLASADLALAKRIAAGLRQLPCVKALGLALASRGIAQVSTNLTGFETTGIQAVYEFVEAQAPILESELVGLAPAAALNPAIAARVKLRDFSPEMILEQRIARMEGSASLD
jgi:glutamate formiminotransferase